MTNYRIIRVAQFISLGPTGCRVFCNNGQIVRYFIQKKRWYFPLWTTCTKWAFSEKEDAWQMVNWILADKRPEVVWTLTEQGIAHEQ